MKKIYHLSSCDTCRKILKTVDAGGAGCELQDIKTDKITPEQLDALRDMAGSYEALFSRRSLKFRSMGLHEKQLTEKDYRKLILEEYTFLKRPVIVAGQEIFIGNAASIVEKAKKTLANG